MVVVAGTLTVTVTVVGGAEAEPQMAAAHGQSSRAASGEAMLEPVTARMAERMEAEFFILNY